MGDGGVLEGYGGDGDVEAYKDQPNKPFTDTHDLPDDGHRSDITIADGEPGDQCEVESVPEVHRLLEVGGDEGAENQKGQDG